MIRLKQLTTAVTCIALACAAASPAAALSAKEKQALGVLLGIGAVAVLVDKMDDDKDKKRVRAHAQSQRGPSPAEIRRQQALQDAAAQRDARRRAEAQARRDAERRHTTRFDRRDPVPAACLRNVQARHGTTTVVGKRCADRRTDTRLPQACAFDIRDQGRTRAVYGTGCLQDRGIRISRR
ncbi:hypothetical protein BFP70_18115 [Thioclava sp. SK-1]|uniref:hypothetical protein n=1 Tax=Thioclava sp. SK-1 TaxID=1889770 RepID=UPI000825F094|nr:hypothetical protein [Thioclava sp. SK-1]OCX59836.1 hypothetical protein BFP70_18115 [Thioclava sp. SK-1]